MVPDTGLNLADVGAAHHQHTQSALTDTAADGQGQFIVKEHLVERQRPAVITAGDPKLVVQGLRIHADAHGGNFKAYGFRYIRFRYKDRLTSPFHSW